MSRPLPLLALSLVVLTAAGSARAQDGQTWQGERGEEGAFGVYRQQQPIFSFTFDGGGGLDGASGGVGLRLEGDGPGFLARFGVVQATFGDGTALWSLEPTWALIARQNLRLRLRGGLAGAHSSAGLSMVSFSVGSDAVLCLFGPFDLEADVTYTPFPFTRLEGSAAVAMLAGPFSFRAGVRGIHYDDQGNDTGEVLGASFVGPFIGFGLHL